jgi:hypothetical protein
MAKSNFALFICDLHKSRDSHRYIGNATSLTKVRVSVNQLLKNNVIENNTGVKVKEMELRDFQELDYFNIVEVENNQIEVTGSYYV